MYITVFVTSIHRSNAVISNRHFVDGGELMGIGPVSTQCTIPNLDGHRAKIKVIVKIEVL